MSKEKNNELKTKEQVLDQLYMSPQDLKILMPTLGIGNCRDKINEIREEMKEKNLYVPDTTPKLALTKLVRRNLGI